ncbi:MAG: L-threonylcarbamoyladenylate synthase [Pikeienuella sp.]
MTQLWSTNDIDQAAEALSRGELVAFPTETVYGLGGDGRSDDAVAAIYAAKGRPSFNPLILHVASLAAAEEIAELPKSALLLAEAFWPGPLTIVAPLRVGAGASALARAGLPTIALRVPAHPIAQALLHSFGGPVAAPSANPSGRISPTTAQHVMSGLSGKIAGVIDGGQCEVGLESTIIGFDGKTPIMLRAGGLAAEDIERVLAEPLRAHSGAITAPGQLISHYAPRARLRLEATQIAPGEALIGFGNVPDAAVNLSPTGDLTEAAARLFAALHDMDEKTEVIAVSPIPHHGLGAAINDRLRRAAAPRDS